jgi:hypothetical protein
VYLLLPSSINCCSFRLFIPVTFKCNGASPYYHMSLPHSTVLTLFPHLCIFPCLSLFVWLSSPYLDLDHQEWSLPSCVVHLPTFSQPQRRSNEGGGGAVLSGDSIVPPRPVVWCNSLSLYWPLVIHKQDQIGVVVNG